MEQIADMSKLIKLMEVFSQLSLEEQAYIIGYATHMAHAKEYGEKKGA